MDNDYTIKVIFISVSLFVTMFVLTLVMNYYTIAKDTAKLANLKVDIAESYDAIVKSQDASEVIISGAETQSLIRKYAMNKYVTMNIISVADNTEHEDVEDNINRAWYDSSKKIIDERYLSKINPSWRVKVKKIESGKYITLNLLLDYDLNE